MSREYVVEHRARPWTTNAERKASRWERADLTRTWREAFCVLARAQRIPTLDRVRITVEPLQARGPLQDTAACNPAAKAAIDGLVDAYVVPDDTGRHVAEIVFLPARKDYDALRLTITELP